MLYYFKNTHACSGLSGIYGGRRGSLHGYKERGGGCSPGYREGGGVGFMDTRKEGGGGMLSGIKGGKEEG